MNGRGGQWGRGWPFRWLTLSLDDSPGCASRPLAVTNQFMRRSLLDEWSMRTVTFEWLCFYCYESVRGVYKNFTTVWWWQIASLYSVMNIAKYLSSSTLLLSPHVLQPQFSDSIPNPWFYFPPYETASLYCQAPTSNPTASRFVTPPFHLILTPFPTCFPTKV